MWVNGKALPPSPLFNLCNQPDHLTFFIWNLIVDFINFGHQVLIVGQQGRELAGLVQAWAQDSWDLLDQRL